MEADYTDIEIDNGRWRSQARCREKGFDIFFIEGKGCSSRYISAKILCFQCPVQRQCLDYAVKNGIKDGVWGGLAYRQRLSYKKGKRKARLTINDVLRGNSATSLMTIEKLAESLSMNEDEVRLYLNTERNRVRKQNAKRIQRQYERERKNGQPTVS